MFELSETAECDWKNMILSQQCLIMFKNYPEYQTC